VNNNSKGILLQYAHTELLCCFTFYSIIHLFDRMWANRIISGMRYFDRQRLIMFRDDEILILCPGDIKMGLQLSLLLRTTPTFLLLT